MTEGFTITSTLRSIVIKLGKDEQLVDDWMEVLRKHLFDDNLSQFVAVTSHDWAAMGLPVRVFVELRPLLQQLPQTSVLSSRRRTSTVDQSSTPRSGSKLANSSNSVDAPPEYVPSLSETLKEEIKEASKKKKRKSMVKRFQITAPTNSLESTDNPVQVQEKIVEINLVGTQSTTLVKVLNGISPNKELPRVVVYGQALRVKFIVSSDIIENATASTNILLFDVTLPETLKTFSDNKLKYFPNVSDDSYIASVPTILVGTGSVSRETVRKKGKRFISTCEAIEVMQELKAFTYVELKNIKDPDEVQGLMHAVGRIILSKFTGTEPKSTFVSGIHNTIITSGIELSLRKKTTQIRSKSSTFVLFLTKIKSFHEFASIFS